MPLLTKLREKLKTMNRRLWIAMICYGILIAVALYSLLPVHTKNESFILTMVLLVFALLIIKTLAHSND
jgi:hypothetical protein